MGEKSERNPCDRGKQGVKRNTLTEANGVVVGLAVEGANRHDMKLVRETLDSVPPIIAAKRDQFLNPDCEVDCQVDREKPVPQSGLCLDAGYDYDEVREFAAEFGYTTHIRCRGQEKQARRDDKRRGAGSLSARTSGSIASGGCSFVGTKKPNATLPSSTWLVPFSLGINAYLDRL